MNNIQKTLPFSVLISVYNNEKPEFFELALKSIFHQSLVPNEVVLVCDGTLKHELIKIIFDFKTKYPNILMVFEYDKNMGLGYALNYGIEKCSNEYVFRADSDDINDYKRFEIQLNFMIDNPEIDVLGTSISEFYNNPNQVANVKKMPETHKDIVKMMKYRNPINHMTVLFKKNSVISAGSYIHLKYLEDYYLWIRLLLRNAIFANVNNELVKVRIGNGLYNRRSDRAYLINWSFLSDFMFVNNLISRTQKITNKILIRLFIYSPVELKKYLYKYILRRK